MIAKSTNRKGAKNRTHNLHGVGLLNHPFLNKGTAFTKKERAAFALDGLLPQPIETLETQSQRAYQQFQNQPSAQEKNLYLSELHATNQILFYHLVQAHLDEMLPILYTPNVANAVTAFNSEFRRPNGLYLAYPDRKQIAQILENYLKANKQMAGENADLIIVVTDGERILGIGDQGVGGVQIVIAKGMLYTLLAGIHPKRVLPIVLDVGTNNRALLNDPLYLGWRHERLSGKTYDDFVATFINAIQEKFPYALVHWEDFGRDNAARILARYQHVVPSFNDDIQGTGAVTLAAILAAIETSGKTLTDQRLVIFGAGTAGIGIAKQIIASMKYAGINEKDAHNKFWLLDKDGLLLTDMQNLTPEQRLFARDRAEIKSWHLRSSHMVSLDDVVNNIKPTILIGCSTMKGAFTEETVRLMAKTCARPIIFPLSNPIEKCEATPTQLLEWTDGKALIATGSPFPPVKYRGQEFVISQCNNALVYPGIGLGVVAAKANKITDNMLWAACTALSAYTASLRRQCSDLSVSAEAAAPMRQLLPPLSAAPRLAPVIACAVIHQALHDNVINDKAILKLLRPTRGKQLSTSAIAKLIKQNQWTAKYESLE